MGTNMTHAELAYFVLGFLCALMCVAGVRWVFRKEMQ